METEQGGDIVQNIDVKGGGARSGGSWIVIVVRRLTVSPVLPKYGTPFQTCVEAVGQRKMRRREDFLNNQRRISNISRLTPALS